MKEMSIGVFTSVGAGLGASLDFVKELALDNVQLHTPPPEARSPERTQELKKQFEDADIAITVVFAGFAGESYASIPVVKDTVGLVPAKTRKARLKETFEISDWTRAMGCDALGMHIGFIPEDTKNRVHKELVKVARDVCDYCADNGQRFHLETGQETADGLLAFIEDVGRDNLAVNFDPANMILYGTGEPLPALRKIGSFVKSVHCKDAKWSDDPGVAWGTEMPLGEGEVDIPLFIFTLKEIGYLGPLTIEREVPGEQQKTDIRNAVELLRTLR
ncbi:MAG: sugar phosphate isomerase/epimerase family protein [bacterium]|nr:sugar phosphate isomerase/epimerase family protein [bacterium]